MVNRLGRTVRDGLGLSSAAPQVNVRWRRLAGTPRDAEQAARDVVETVTGEIQRRLDASVVLSTAPVGDAARAGEAAQTVQSEEPISYVELAVRFSGLSWNGSPDEMAQVLTSTGDVAETITGVRALRPRTIGGVNEHDPRRRRPQINVRPGRGGLHRRPVSDIDELEGLDAYGEVTWWSVSGGATIGVMELKPDGNTALVARLSSEDNETLVAQLEPTLALARRNSDVLTPRYALFAVNMSGLRDVRPDNAGPPPPGTLERDDMQLLDKWIEEGWLEHVVVRDGDRIARDNLPGETLLRRWRRKNIELWIASYGRKMDYVTDRLSLRAMMMVSAEERDNNTRRMQLAAINKGPLVGKGWGRPKFGFYKDRQRRIFQDPEQWPYVLRMFELADALGSEKPDEFTVRKVTEALAAEGCPFSPAYVGMLLADPTYVTGEWTVKVRGVPIAQRPIELENPVPLDRFLRVREMVSLRQGRSDRTPVGEFLLNYVETVHSQCVGTIDNKGNRIRIRGFLIPKLPGLHRYRHSKVPHSCRRGTGRGPGRAHTWDRDLLERPVVEAVREIATHPEVLRQAALAARHANATTSARLSADQREQLERQAEALRQQQETATDEWIDGFQARGGKVDLEGFTKMMERFKRRIETLERRLTADAQAAAQEQAASTAADHENDRVRTFLEIMTLETPVDPFLKQLRARLFQRIVHGVEIDDPGHGPITITLYGHLVPEGSAIESANPILVAADLLDAYAAQKAGAVPRAEAALEEHAQRFGTVNSASEEKTVPNLYGNILCMPTTEDLQALRRQTLDYTGWTQRVWESRRPGEPSWMISTVVTETSAA